MQPRFGRIIRRRIIKLQPFENPTTTIVIVALVPSVEPSRAYFSTFAKTALARNRAGYRYEVMPANAALRSHSNEAARSSRAGSEDVVTRHS
jgi:hypothetical protein